MSIPQGWSPSLSERQTRSILEQYKGRAELLSPERLEELEVHAQHYNVPYYPGDFSIKDAIHQAAAGFVEGFTTYGGVADHPDNEYESIARNLGHLAGFVPGILSAPIRGLGTIGLLKTSTARNMAAYAASAKSFPMGIAEGSRDILKERAKAVAKGYYGRHKAFETTKNFMLAEKAKHVAEGAYTLGVASAVSAWQGGVDAMMESGVHGAKFGAAFRTLGNLIPGTETHHKASKAIIGSMMQGLSAEQRGATTPEKVYEYLMGAYFGGNEVSWSRAKAAEYIKKKTEKAQIDREWVKKTNMDPENWKDYHDLHEPVQTHVKQMANKIWKTEQRNLEFGYELLENLGQEDKILGTDLRLQGYRPTEKFVDGKRVWEMPEGAEPFKRAVIGGGDAGGDAYFARAAERKGIPQIAITTAAHQKDIVAPGFQKMLSMGELEAVNPEVRAASEKLGRQFKSIAQDEAKLGKIKKHAYEVNIGDAVYAVGQLASGNKKLVGAMPKTSWTVQMGINSGKPTFVFDQVKNKWYEWSKAANSFTELEGTPPRPPARFTGVGTRKLNETGKRAIDELFDTYYETGEGYTEKLALTSELEAETGKRVRRLTTISEQKIEIEGKVADIDDAIKVTKDPAEVQKLRANRKDLVEAHDILVQEENVHKNVGVRVDDKSIPVTTKEGQRELFRQSEFEKTENLAEEITSFGDTDFGGISAREVGTKAEFFVKNHLKDLWVNKASNRPELTSIFEKAGGIIRNTIGEVDKNGVRKFITGTNENRSEELANTIERRINRHFVKKDEPAIALSADAKGELRQWLTKKNNSRLTTYLQSDGVSVNRMPNDKHPYTITGNSKYNDTIEQPIDIAYKKAGGQSEIEVYNPKTKKRTQVHTPAYLILDTVSPRINGRSTDLELSRWRNTHLRVQNGWNKGKADKDYNRFIGNTMEKMDMAENGEYYLFGGRGDSDRLYFTRYHPQMPKQPQLEVNRISEELKVNKLFNDKSGTQFSEQYDLSERNFVGKYYNPLNPKSRANLKKIHQKAFLSNILYELDMNGISGGLTKENIAKINGSGFLKDAKALNKRQQIWFQSGWAGDRAFVQKNIKDLNENGNYNIAFVKDLVGKASEIDQTSLKLLNNQTKQRTDGGIIGRDDVVNVNNKDFGNPESGNSKSFIVSPFTTTKKTSAHKKGEELGALLTKHGVHAAGPKFSELMRKANVHYIAYKSATKQRGMRKEGDYKVTPTELTFIDAPLYDLPPEHVYGSFTVKGSKHLSEPQRLYKQIIGNFLHESHSKIPQRDVNDFFETVIGKRFKGDTEINDLNQAYLNRVLDGTASLKELRTMEDKIVNNIEKLGIREMIKAMKSDDSPQLSQAIYARLLHLQKEFIQSERRINNISDAEYFDAVSELNDMKNYANTLLRISGQWATQERIKGRNVNPNAVFFHKGMRDYRMKAVQNYIVNSATRPKIGNSATGIIRIYDKAMEIDLDGANKLLHRNNKDGINYKDNIIFFDNDVNPIIDTGLQGTYTYGNQKYSLSKIPLKALWKAYDKDNFFSGANKTAVEEAFRAAIARTPQDSASGTQIVHFKGFTGRPGHGVLMHGKVMEALGGADADFDKATVYFGGKGGFKKTWKDGFEAQKKEFYDNKGEKVLDSKEAYEKELTIPFNKRQKDLLESIGYKYSPLERTRISEIAVNSRNQLGPTVQMKQLLNATYNSIVAGGGEDVFTIKTGKGAKTKNYQITIKAKTDTASQKRQRELGRAQMAFSADPMDVLGLKDSNTWAKSLWKSFFDITKVEMIGVNDKLLKVNRKTWDTFIDLSALGKSHLQRGIYKDYIDINSAFWGRNWAENRKYNMHEIIEKGKAINNISKVPERVNNVVAKTAELFNGLDWSDSIFGKLSRKSLDTAYGAHKSLLSEYQWLKPMLGRPTFKTEMGNYIANTFTHELWKPLALNDVANNVNTFKDAISGTQLSTMKQLNEFLKPEKKYESHHDISYQDRRTVLNYIKELGEDFIPNDITDINTSKILNNKVSQMKSENDFGFIKQPESLETGVSQIVEWVDYIKKNNYLMAKSLKSAANLRMPAYEKLPPKQKEAMDKANMIYFGHTTKEVAAHRTRTMDRVTVDKMISDHKSQLTPAGKSLYDHLLLGSLHRGDLQQIDAVINSIKNWDSNALKYIKNLRWEASRTGITRLGMESEAVDIVSKKEHLGSFLNIFNDVWKTPPQSMLTKAIEPLSKNIESQKALEQGMPDSQFDSFMQRATMHTGYEGLQKGDLSPKTKKLAIEIATMLKSKSNKLSNNLNELTRGLPFIRKDLNAMNHQDFLMLRNWLNEMNRGSFIQRMFHKGKLRKDMPWEGSNWLLFPEKLGEKMMQEEIIPLREQGFFTDRFGNPREGVVVRPTNYIDMMQKFTTRISDSATATGDRFVKKFQDKLHFHTGVEDANELWQIGIRTRELNDIDRIMKDPNIHEVNKEVIRDRIIKEHKKIVKSSQYEEVLKNKKYWVSKLDPKTNKHKRVEMTGERLVDEINSSLTTVFEDAHTFTTGIKTGNNKLPDALYPYILGYRDTAKLNPVIDYKTFIRHLQAHAAGLDSPFKKLSRHDIPQQFGIDGLRIIARSMLLDILPKTPEGNKVRKKIEAEPVLSTGKLPFEAYFPHMFFETGQAKKITNQAIKKILSLPESEMTQKIKEREIKKLLYKNQGLDGDWNFKDLEEFDLFKEIVEDINAKKAISNDRIKWFNANERAGSMHARSAYTPNYSIEPGVVEAYLRSLSNTYHRQLSQMFSRHIVTRMKEEMPRRWGKEQTKNWVNYMELYAQDAIGNPTIIPDRIYNDPAMKLKNSPYGWWADNRVLKKVNTVAEKLGLVDTKLPENLRGLDYRTMQRWSNLEAQFQMSSLLAHPKFMVGNVFGGTMHTIQSAGIRSLIKARNYSYLSKINPKWTNKEAVQDFVTSVGVLPEFLLHQFGMEKSLRNSKGRGFLKELGEKLSRNPNLDKKSVNEIAKKYGLWEKVTQLSAKFMTGPEIMLRRDSFMAHYIHAWETFGGAIKEFDHPFLVELGKKGVKATQFLYDAPNRPAFARTSLGKVMTRFQLWSWNSVRFRNEVRRQARIYGYLPGTEAMQRFERSRQIDLMVLALANAFHYSLFENNLPAPMNWIQDTSEWLFGDEKERDRAFYGTYPGVLAPLQIATPPVTRPIIAGLKGFLGDEEDRRRLSQYYVYSMFPLGRIARSVSPWRDNSLIHKPIMFGEELFGIPFIQMQRYANEYRKNENDDIIRPFR